MQIITALDTLREIAQVCSHLVIWTDENISQVATELNLDIEDQVGSMYRTRSDHRIVILPLEYYRIFKMDCDGMVVYKPEQVAITNVSWDELKGLASTFHRLNVLSDHDQKEIMDAVEEGWGWRPVTRKVGVMESDDGRQVFIYRERPQDVTTLFSV
jgi:hypothetical protein